MFIDTLCEFDNDGSSGGATGVATTSLIKNAISAGLSANATTAVSSFSYDTFAPGVPTPAIGGQPAGGIGGPLLHDIGRGRPVNLLIQVSTAMASSATATMAVDFINTTSSDLTGSVTVLESSPLIAISLGAGTQGYRFPMKTVPMKVLKRYVGLQYRNGTAPISAGGIEACMATVADDHSDAFGG